MPNEEATASLARWTAWVDELTLHPLDDVEFEGMLECRDRVAEWLEITGDVDAASSVDADDARFQDLTMERRHEQFAVPEGAGWWWERVPVDPEAFARFLGDY